MKFFGEMMIEKREEKKRRKKEVEMRMNSVFIVDDVSLGGNIVVFIFYFFFFADCVLAMSLKIEINDHFTACATHTRVKFVLTSQPSSPRERKLNHTVTDLHRNKKISLCAEPNGEK